MIIASLPVFWEITAVVFTANKLPRGATILIPCLINCPVLLKEILVFSKHFVFPFNSAYKSSSTQRGLKFVLVQYQGLSRDLEITYLLRHFPYILRPHHHYYVCILELLQVGGGRYLRENSQLATLKDVNLRERKAQIFPEIKVVNLRE